jgi:hypothetical protein
MCRLGQHRMRPERSPANQARPALARLDSQLAAAKRKGDAALVAKIENERAWLIVNSLR